MSDLDEYFLHKKAMGNRFKQFRKAIGKSKQELAEESGIIEERIKWFEEGTIIPDIIFIQYFIEKYGLNLTWLVKGTGEPFFKKDSREKTEDRRQSRENALKRLRFYPRL